MRTRLVVVFFVFALFLGTAMVVSADSGLRVDVRRTDGSLGGGNWAEPGECRITIDGNMLSNVERQELNRGDREVDFGDGTVGSYSGDESIVHTWEPGAYKVTIRKGNLHVTSSVLFAVKVDLGSVQLSASGEDISVSLAVPNGGEPGVVVAYDTWFRQAGASEDNPAYLAVNGRVAPNQRVSNPGTSGVGHSFDVPYIAFGGPRSVTFTLHPPDGGWASFTSSKLVLYYLPLGSPRIPDNVQGLGAFNVVAKGEKAGDVLIIRQVGQPQLVVHQDGEWLGWHGVWRQPTLVELHREIPGQGWVVVRSAWVEPCGNYDVSAWD